MNKPLKDVLAECDVVSIKPYNNDNGEVCKIVVEYQPADVKKEIKTWN